MYCKHCGNTIDNTTAFCEHCGHPTTKDIAAENRKKNIVGLVLSVFAGLAVLAIIVIAVYGLGSTSSIESLFSNSNNGVQDPPDKSNIHGEGTYKVGSDIEAGEYFVYSTSPISCYFEVSSDSSGQLTSIITNDNISTFAFVTVEAGQYLKVNGGNFMKAADASVPGADANGNYSAGMYRVGIDIPAGEYKVICTSEIWCYIEVSSDSSGSLYSIVSNENINTFSYITVSDGQYLTVNGGQFTHVE